MQAPAPFFVTTPHRPFLADLNVRVVKHYQDYRGCLLIDVQHCNDDGPVPGMCETLCLSAKDECSRALRHSRLDRVVQLKWLDPNAASAPSSTWLG